MQTFFFFFSVLLLTHKQYFIFFLSWLFPKRQSWGIWWGGQLSPAAVPSRMGWHGMGASLWEPGWAPGAAAGGVFGWGAGAAALSAVPLPALTQPGAPRSRGGPAAGEDLGQRGAVPAVPGAGQSPGAEPRAGCSRAWMHPRWQGCREPQGRVSSGIAFSPCLFRFKINLTFPRSGLCKHLMSRGGELPSDVFSPGFCCLQVRSPLGCPWVLGSQRGARSCRGGTSPAITRGWEPLAVKQGTVNPPDKH